MRSLSSSRPPSFDLVSRPPSYRPPTDAARYLLHPHHPPSDAGPTIGVELFPEIIEAGTSRRRARFADWPATAERTPSDWHGAKSASSCSSRLMYLTIAKLSP